ncbi:interferon gamma [Octodon degus]|uniref:Interferon gamma n=1 Tax=Octodon degus TaxID=10160 RepID=A0A6P3EUS0_OCTDE|nr:interferon gamma [Octodon degus]
MKYTSSIFVLQLCIILGFSSGFCKSQFMKDIGVLADYFEAQGSEAGAKGHLFIDILKNCQNESDKKIFQSQIISFYFKLFEIANKTNETVKTSVDTIKEHIISRFLRNQSNLEIFQNLTQLSVRDKNVQRQAIIELKTVMEDLGPKQRKRRRSQTLFAARAHPNKNHAAYNI